MFIDMGEQFSDIDAKKELLDKFCKVSIASALYLILYLTLRRVW